MIGMILNDGRDGSCSCWGVVVLECFLPLPSPRPHPRPLSRRAGEGRWSYHDGRWRGRLVCSCLTQSCSQRKPESPKGAVQTPSFPIMTYASSFKPYSSMDGSCCVTDVVKEHGFRSPFVLDRDRTFSRNRTCERGALELRLTQTYRRGIPCRRKSILNALQPETLRTMTGAMMT